MNVKKIGLNELSVKNPFVSEYWAEIKSHNNWDAKAFLIIDDEFSYEIIVLTKPLLMNLCIAYIPFSPVSLNNNIFLEQKKLKAALLLIKKLITNKIVFFKIDLPYEYSNELDFSKSFILNKESVQPELTIRINLDDSIENIKAKYKKRAKRNLNKNKDIIKTVSVEINKENIDIWYNIYVETAKRDGFQPRSYDYVSKILTTKKDVKVQLLFAYYNEEVVGGIILISSKSLAVYLLGASKKIDNISASYSIQDFAIDNLKEQNIKIYDLYGIGDETNSKHLKSLTLFKTSFGGEILKRVPTLDLPINKVLYKGYKLAEKIRNSIYR
ncbi:MAG: lipid II:glycine glycyltransferase FemX [Pleomorphochaeta sp.]